MGRIVRLSELGKQKRTRRSRVITTVTEAERARAFPAKYKGKCPLCLEPIVTGEQIFFRSGPKPMHVTCPRAKKQPTNKRRSVSATG